MEFLFLSEDNISRSIDISGKKEYNYEYEEGRIVRATEADIELSGEIVTSKVIINTVKYYYDTEGKMTKKVITPASGDEQIYKYTNPEGSNPVVTLPTGVVSQSGNDKLPKTKSFIAAGAHLQANAPPPYVMISL